MVSYPHKTAFPFIFFLVVCYATRQCCEPSEDADEIIASHFAGCQCLHDNVPLIRERVGPGEERHYHWRLSDWNLINRDDIDRPPIHLRLEPCSGSPELYVMPLWTPFPGRNDYRWNATKGRGELNIVEVPLHYADYYISVISDRNSTYTISAMTDLSKLSPAPTPQSIGPISADKAGNGTEMSGTNINDVLTMSQEGPALVAVSWKTSPKPGTSYQLFYQKYPNDTAPDSVKCSDSPNSTVDACVLWTACGLEDHGIPSDEGGYEEFPPDTVVTKYISELKLDERYFFNVAIKSKYGLLTSYSGVTAVTKYEKLEEAFPASTTTIIYAVSGTIFFLLVAGVIVAKLRLNRAYKLKPGKFGFSEKDVNWQQIAEKRKALRKSSKERAAAQKPPTQ